MKRIYLSGPMSGLPDHNYPAFNEVEKVLTSYGWEVVNPASNFNGATDRHRADYMRLDFTHVLSVDTLFVLPGWEKSRGARVEVLMAQELGIPVYYHDELYDAGFMLNAVEEKVVTYVR